MLSLNFMTENMGLESFAQILVVLTFVKLSCLLTEFSHKNN